MSPSITHGQGRCAVYHRLPFSLIRDRSTDMFQRSVATPSGPEAIRHMPERGFKERLDDLLHGTLYNTVFYGRHTEGPELPRFAGLGYPALSAREIGTIGTRPQFLPHALKICVFSLRTDMLDGNPVDARRSLALVCGNGPPGTPQVAAVGNPTPQLAVLLLRGFPDSTDRVFSARRVTRPYRSFASVSTDSSGFKNLSISCPPSPVDGFPVPRLLRGLRPVRVLPRSPRIACFRNQADTHGSHVPVLNPLDG